MSETTEMDSTLLGCIGALLLIPFLTIYGVVVSGFVFKVLWGWFIAPQFGLATLSFAEACGLGVIVTVLRGQIGERDKTEKEKERGWVLHLLIQLTTATLIYAWLLGVGYVIHRWWL